MRPGPVTLGPMTLGSTRLGPARVVGAALVLLVVAQGALLLWHHQRTGTDPHDVPVGLHGPAVLTQGAADQLAALPGRPVDAVVLRETVDPRTAVRDGAVVATLSIDLDQPGNVLYLSTVDDPDLDVVLQSMAHRLSAPMERSVVTRDVAPASNADVSRAALAAACGAWVVTGFLLALGWSVLRRLRGAGPPGGRFLLALAAVSAVAGVAVAAVVSTTHGGSWTTWALLGAATAYATGVAATALEAVLGPIGLAVASTLLVFVDGPLFGGRDPRLLPSPWAELAPWTLHGAASGVAAPLTWFGSSGVLQGALVLGGVTVIGVVVVLAASQAAQPARAATDGEHEPTTGAHWRLRALAVAVPVAMSVVAATVLAPARATVVSATPAPGAAQTECLAAPEVTTIDELNDFVDSVRGGPSFQGADVGADVLLQDGRRLWVFGDTLRAPDFPGSRFVRNSMLVFGDGCAATVLPASGGALIPDRADGVGYWPMSIAREARDGYDLVGVTAQRVRTTSQDPDDPFAFESLGPAIAVFVVRPGEAPQLVVRRDLGPDDTDTDNPTWGAATAVHDGWVYLYGTARPGTPGVFGFSLHVARTRVDDVLDQSAWQFWDGSAWQGSAMRTAELIAADQGVSQTLSVFSRGGRWYAVSKRDEVFGNDLVIWSAPSPTGPFDAGTSVAELPSDLAKGQLRYMPLAHPDLIGDKRTIVVSYSRNNTDVDKVEDNPFLYRPEFLQVPLPRP